MADIVVYHNGECSKCRGALELLQEIGVPHEVRFYISEPLSVEEIRILLRQLDLPVTELIRKGEALFTERYANAELSDEGWIQVLIEHPQLMQRPIVLKGDKAIIARPPEKVLEFVK